MTVATTRTFANIRKNMKKTKEKNYCTIAKELKKSWGINTTNFAKKLGVSVSTAQNWISGGNPKEVGRRILEIASRDRNLDAGTLYVYGAEERDKHTAAEWVQFLMQSLGDYRLSQFARRLGLSYATVSAWARSEKRRLKNSAETLLLYVYLNPEKFPER